MSLDIYQEPQHVNPQNQRRPTKRPADPLRRRRPHTTRGGIGVVGKLRKKRNGKEKVKQ